MCYKGHYLYDFIITPAKIFKALKWLKQHHSHYANVTINDKWFESSKEQDFNLHSGLINSTVHVDADSVDGHPVVSATCSTVNTDCDNGTAGSAVNVKLVANAVHSAHLGASSSPAACSTARSCCLDSLADVDSLMSSCGIASSSTSDKEL